ncbi:hypothetical protein SK128_011863 [Halocaridina rubra]|uniref:Small subunit processome component 20 homolog n=1 Tax=Halocaridina rubra TaxID=373956 RepID=A0AAN8WHR0_HALRR
MKDAATRQSHKHKNTYVFKGFSEKVRALRVNARKYMLQRPQNTDGEDVTFFYDTLNKCRDLNLTEDFKAFLQDLHTGVKTTAQLVHHEEHVVQCLCTHISKPNSLALQPLLDLVVALANDMPQELYKCHFYKLLPKLLSHLVTKDPDVIESVFLCIVSLFVVLQKYLCEDLYELYHVQNFSLLLSKSYPWYINNLAAQSLSVLVRKVPKYEYFIGMAFRKLKMDESQTLGVGSIFASMMKSDVIQRIHSCAPKVLGMLLDHLDERDNIPLEPALKAILHAVSQVAKYVTTPHAESSSKWQTHWNEDSALIWPVLLGHVKSFVSHKSLEAVIHQLDAILQIVLIFVSHKQGALITNVDDIVTHCLSILEVTIPDFVGNTLNSIFIALLVLPQHIVSRKVLERITTSLLSSSCSCLVKFEFMRDVVEFQRFDSEILPLLLPYLNTLMGSAKDKDVPKDIIHYIAYVTAKKRPLCNTGMDLSSWHPYIFDFSRLSKDSYNETNVCTFIENKIKEGIEEGLSNFEDLSLSLLCIPHLLPINHQDLAPYLTWIFNDALALLTDKTEKLVDSDKAIVHKKKKTGGQVPEVKASFDMNVKGSTPQFTKKVLFLIGLVIEVMSHIYTHKDFLAILGQNELFNLLKKKCHYRENVHFLKAMDIHFTIASLAKDEGIINETFLKEVYLLLAPAISSANPQVRLLTIHILSVFPVSIPSTPDSTESVDSLFKVLLKCECVPISPFEFKERLRYITMLDADHVKKHSPSCGSFAEAPLLLFLGQLYTNFKDIWSPLISAIASHANSIPLDTFWTVWYSKLKIASSVAYEVLHGQYEVDVDDLDINCPLLLDINNALTVHPGYIKLPPKTDHLNYRDSLWRSMETFPQICESKNRDIVPLFFEFLEKEFFPVDFTIAPTQDIRQLYEPVEAMETETQVIALPKQNKNQDTPAIDTNNDIPNKEREDILSSPQRASIKSLCVHLTLFSKFRNPKMLSQSKKLERMYQELLSHPSPKLQKISFDCLLTYNHSYLTPYKEKMYEVLQNKSLTNTLTLFSIDGSDKVLDEEHRKNFMPYLMRILYGKMHYKTGSKNSGKSRINVRKAVVLRFLAGASEEEFETFLELAFDVLLTHAKGSPLDVLHRSVQNFDLRKVVPLKRLKGALSTLENILEKIGNKMTYNKSFLLNIIIYIVKVASLMLDNRSKIKSNYVSFLKHIRQHAQKLIVKFFSLFEDYAWTPEEIEAVFEVIVWPNLERLPDEGLASPTPLLSLFECWANNPRYFPLLAVVHKGTPSLTPLKFIVRLTTRETCSTGVTNTIFNMVEKLLTLTDYDETQPDEDGKIVPAINCTPLVEIKRLLARDGETQQNFGTALLVPHLEGLLQSMKLMVKRLSKGMKATPRDLTILTSLTEWVASKEICADLLELIFPLIIEKHIKSEDVIAQLLTTCSYLLNIVDNSDKFLRPLISQFGCLTKRASRDALCQAVAAIASVHPHHKLIADLALDLNSWNKRMVDEVDYDRRLDGYKKMTDLCKTENQLCIDFCHFLVYSNMHVMCYVDDSSLRDMSLLSIEQLIDMCIRLRASFPAEFKQIMIDRLLCQVRCGLGNEREDVRHSMFFILQKLVHRCHSYNEKLQDLYKLADETEDEGDFYSNMMHIQRHRRARALTRLADKLRHGELELREDTISDFLIPLVRVHLFRDDYAKDDYLMQASVRCIGAFAKHLSWYPYLRLLRSFMAALAKEDLKYLRLIVKMIEAIINGFHEEIVEVIPNKEKESSVPELTMEQVKLPPTDQDEIRKDKETKDLENADKPISVDGAKLDKAQKVYMALVSTVIPQIQKILAAKTASDKKHKVNKSKFPEDEDIKRIPLALALVKLMKKLPSKVLDANVNSVLMKLITFLKSQSQTIRDEARAMLVKIMVELGGQYLAWLVRDLRSILTKGFQTHVLVYTLHGVLSQMRLVLKSNDVDACLIDMIEICKEDILGIQAEEKKVAKITSKVMEARSDKSYAILDFTAEYISAMCLSSIILPLREVLAHTQDKKVVNKMVRCLEEIASGLQRNQNITLMHKSLFIYGILSEKLMLLSGEGKTSVRGKKVEHMNRLDSYLLAPEPKASKQIPKTSIQATSYVFVEFALKLLASLVRSEKFNPENSEDMKLLDPYVHIMAKFIGSEHPEISILALKCVNLIVRYPLSSLEKQIKDICSEMFVLLHKYSSPELARGKLYNLVQLTFRSLAFIIRTVSYYQMSEEQVRVLLQYVQESLDDSSQQTIVFAILQSIIGKKIDTPELHSLIEQVKKMSIMCTRQYALNQARVTFYTYLLTYPMKRKAIVREINYYLGNLAYCIEEGRYSAITMIHSIVTNFPVKIFEKEMETNIWLKVTEQLVREEFKEHRSLLHKTLKTLYERSVRKSYFIELCMKLTNEEKEVDVNANSVAIQFGCRALSAFLDVSVKKQPKNLLGVVIPKLLPLTNPSRYSNQMKGVCSLENTESCVNTDVLQVDKALIMLTQVFNKLVTQYIGYPEGKEHITNDLWKNIQVLLLYPHIQVRLNAAGLIGQLLASCPIEGSDVPVLCCTVDKARSLMLDLCEVLQSQAPTDSVVISQLTLAVVRNIIYLIRNSERVSLVKKDCDLLDTVEEDGVSESDASRKVERHPLIRSALWVMHRVGDLAYKELVNSGNECTMVREAFLNLLAGIIVVVGDKLQTPMLFNYIIKHLARELSDKRLPRVLVNRTQEVASLVKSEVGLEIYTRHLTTAQTSLSKKKFERKAQEHQQKVVNPRLANKKKKQKHLAGKLSKKRKLALKKGKLFKSKKAKLRANAIVQNS